MNESLRRRIAFLALACLLSSLTGVSFAVAQSTEIEEARKPNSEVPTLDLTLAQKKAIYQEVRRGKSREAPIRFAPQVGADVPPMITLYPLPEAILENDPVTRLYQFTRVEDQIVLVDPTKMRVVAVIEPQPGE